MEEALAKAQSFVNEHAQTIGMVLVAVVLLAGVAWFLMTRNSTKSDVLENASRVNEASTSQAAQSPTQEQLEELARQRADMESNSVEANANSALSE